MKTCSKVYTDIPFGHRASEHEGHCKFIHGHNWAFEITFTGEPDQNGFVMDFGKLHSLRDTFAALFDHKLLINEADPLKDEILAFVRRHKIDNVTLVDDCSCEGIAQLVYGLASAVVRDETDGRVAVDSVTVYEDTKNAACYR